MGIYTQALVDVRMSTLCNFHPRQQAAWDAIRDGAKYVLYGGAMGGGKSRFLRWALLRRTVRLNAAYRGRHVTAMLCCENYPALRDRHLMKIEQEFPSEIGHTYQDHRVYGHAFVIDEGLGGGAICFRNLDDPAKYQSAEFATIGVDELTKNPLDVFSFLRTRMRWEGVPDDACVFIGASNPGGIGHGWVKQLWIDRKLPPEFLRPVDYSDRFVFIRATAEDNHYLDPGYWDILNTLPEQYREAFRNGSWNVYIGQAFTEFTEVAHVIDDCLPPDNADIIMTFDWGFGRPFSTQWWYVDPDGRLIHFAEWYGSTGTPNQGLRLTDSDIARGIVVREVELGIANRVRLRLAGPDCFQRRPNYLGGGQGPSTAEVWMEFGLQISPGDVDRATKIRAFRERLRHNTGEAPMLLVCRRCEAFRRTIPALSMDDVHVEDVDTKGEDHAYDAACHVAMHRRLGESAAAQRLNVGVMTKAAEV